MTSSSESHHLPPTEFLARLGSLFTQTHAKAHGSVHLTQKLLPSSEPTSGNGILLRATNGLSKRHCNERTKVREKTKLSTIIPIAETGKETDEFFAQYAEVCKRGMEGLRKRDRKAKAKAKAKGKKAKEKKGKGGKGG